MQAVQARPWLRYVIQILAFVCRVSAEDMAPRVMTVQDLGTVVNRTILLCLLYKTSVRYSVNKSFLKRSSETKQRQNKATARNVYTEMKVCNETWVGMPEQKVKVIVGSG